MKYCPECEERFETGERCPADDTVLVLEAETVDPFLGSVLKDAYRVESVLGSGGMGTVYLGTQLALGRRVAIKVLRADHGSERDLIRRFLREVKISSQLNHPNIVQVIDGGNTETGLCFLVMEYLEGTELSDFVPSEEGLAFDVLAPIFDQVCAGVAEAHRVGLIHRDIKPPNIFIVERPGRPLLAKVLDFGIAKRPDATTQITREGAIIGTPGFMSPEQMTGDHEPDGRSDIYSLGGVLYYMATGYTPFSGETLTKLLAQQLNELPTERDWTALKVPAGVGAVAMKALQRVPGDRYQSVDELRAAMNALGKPGSERAAMADTLPVDRLATTLDAKPAAAAAAVDMGPTPLSTESAQSNVRRAAFQVQRRVFIGGGLALVGGASLWAARGMWTPKPKLVFGMSAAFSGPAQELGHAMRVGVQSRLLAQNDAGGVQGHMLELRALDDSYEPEAAAANTERLLSEGALAMVGSVGTPTAEVAVPVALSHRAPFIGAMTGATLLRKDPPDRYVFNYRASYAQEVEALLGYLVGIRKVDPRRIAVFAQQDSFGATVVDSLHRSLGHDHDLLQVGYHRNKLDVSDAVDTMVASAARVEAVIMVATYRPAAHFIKALHARGARPVCALVSFVGSSAFAQELSDLSPEAMDGVIVSQVVPHPDSHASGVIRYRKDLATYHPEEHPGFISLEGYLAASLLIEGLSRARTMQREALVDALESLTDLDIGIGTRVSFDGTDHQASDKVWGTMLNARGIYESLELT